jgi:hypothetical protein
MNKFEHYLGNTGIVLAFLLTILSAVGLFIFGYEVCLYPFLVFGLLSLLVRPYWRKTGKDD